MKIHLKTKRNLKTLKLGHILEFLPRFLGGNGNPGYFVSILTIHAEELTDQSFTVKIISAPDFLEMHLNVTQVFPNASCTPASTPNFVQIQRL